MAPDRNPSAWPVDLLRAPTRTDVIWPRCEVAGSGHLPRVAHLLSGKPALRASHPRLGTAAFALRKSRGPRDTGPGRWMDVDMKTETRRTYCRLCVAMCGVDIDVQGDRVQPVEPTLH